MKNADYDEIKALADSDARAAADVMRQKAIDDLPVGTVITEDMAGALAEIYRYTYEKVYAERLNHHENEAFLDAVNFLRAR